ncbi:MAG: 4-(cytidine 5'-diphospho)-2-C-methyl-D-erythritol kinase [Ferruginibacter sp.]
MISFPNCKINLGLNILRRRDDGFHDLETVFYPVALKDVLELIRTDHAETDIQYSASGFTIEDETENNLCIRAYKLLKKNFPELSSIKMHLHKNIPMGAGLGGGSADAAFTLKLLNNKFQLNLSDEQLLNYAAFLGSDGPFFIMNKSCFATGRGEILTPIDLDLSAYNIVLINPGIHINTGWAFTQLDPAVPVKNITAIIHQPISSWKNELVNDFEKPVFKLYPQLQQIKEELYSKGALYAAMSGSGSTVFGIFNKELIPDLDLPPEYFIKTVPA